MPPAPAAPRRAAPAPDARAALAGATAAAGLSAAERLARREERPRRRWLLVGAGLIVIVALVLVLALRGGSSGSSGGSSAAQGGSQTQGTTGTSKHTSSTKKPAKTPAKAAPPAETAVTVLNGTETEGLARRISSELQQNGYSQAAASFGRPPGANEVTVVEYVAGHQADAEGVAHSLSVTHVQPIEQAVAALAGSAKVVVIVGADKAKSSP
jgi:hypothetical protein